MRPSAKRSAPATEFRSARSNLFTDFISANLVATKILADHKRAETPQLATPSELVLDEQVALDGLSYSVNDEQRNAAYELSLHCLLTPLTDSIDVSNKELLLDRLRTFLPPSLQKSPPDMKTPLTGIYLESLKKFFSLVLSEQHVSREFMPAWRQLASFNDIYVARCETGISIAQLVDSWHQQCAQTRDQQAVAVWAWLFSFLSRESQAFVILGNLHQALKPTNELMLLKKVLRVTGTKYALREAQIRSYQPLIDQLTVPTNPLKPYQALPVKARLVVTIHRARDLKRGKLSLDFRCDAYVQVIYNVKNKFSSVESGAEPVWEWERRMWDRWTRGSIIVKVWDKDPLNDKLLGEVQFQYDDIVKTPVECQWFSLDSTANDGGELMISVKSYSLNPPSTCGHPYAELYRVLLHRVFFQDGRCDKILSEFVHRYGISRTHHDQCLLELLTSHITADPQHLDAITSLLPCAADPQILENLCLWAKKNLKVVPPSGHVFQMIQKIDDLECVQVDWLVEIEAGALNGFSEIIEEMPFVEKDCLEWAAKLLAYVETLEDLYAPAIAFEKFRGAYVKGALTVIALTFCQHIVMSDQNSLDASQKFSLYFLGRRLLEKLSFVFGSRKITDAMLPLDHMLLPALKVWSVEMASRLSDWSDSAVSLDAWTPISSDEDHLHSTSVVDLFSSIYQGHEFLLQLNWDYHGQTHVNLHDYWDGVSCQVVRRYGESISGTLKSYLTTVRHHKFQFSNEMGVRLNNLQVARTNLLKLMVMLEDEGDPEVSALFSATERFLSDIGRECINQIAMVMLETIDPLISKITEPTEALRQKRKKMFSYLFSHLRDSDGDGVLDAKDEDDDNDGIHDDLEGHEERIDITGANLDTLQTFIDNQLKIAHNSLYYRLFRGLMREIWQRIVNEICDELVSAVNEVEVMRAHKLFEVFKAQFGGDDSLIKKKLVSGTKQFNVVLRARKVETATLIQMIESEGSDHALQDLLAIMKSRQRRRDKEAYAFFKKRAQK